MYFEHIYERGLAQSSYIVGCQATGTAIVIDPRRDVDIYEEIAGRENLTIAYVTETHIHADYLSGARELARRTGAELLLSDEGGDEWSYDVPHTGLHDGDAITVGNVRLEVLHTPGHTPEHISFLLFDLPAGPEPRMLFTGDFVFVGDVGRPDLLDEAAGHTGTREPGARQMFQSLKRIASLPDQVLIWPGHGAGSACGKSLGAVPVTTLGFERATAWAFQETDEDRFVDTLLDGQPEPPRYFAEMKVRNRRRPDESVMVKLPAVPHVDLSTVRAQNPAVQLVDVRSSEQFLARHVPGSLNVPFDVGMSTWFGWFLAYDQPIVAIAERGQVEAVQRALVRVGLDGLVGFAEPQDVDGQSDCVQTQSVDVERAHALIHEGAAVLDVRGRSEYEEGHISNAQQIHLGFLPKRLEEVPSDRPVVVHCQGGYRSAVACSVLEALGRRNVINLEGGYLAWELEEAARAVHQ